jgi:hypothetical protein
LKTRNGKNNIGRYYVVDEKTGLSLPSVTTILGETGDKSGLDNWIQRVGQAEADRISRFSANRGTYMHTLHEYYIEGKYIKPVENPLQFAFVKSREACSTLTDAEIECGKNLFFNFLHNSDFYDQIKSVIFQEAPVWSQIGGGYAGRLDLSIYGLNDKAKMIDFKTSRKPKNEDWITGYKKQISAYSIAMYERYGILVESAEIWISCETGEVQVFKLTLDEIKHWFGEFHTNVKKYHEMYPNN